MRPWMVVALAIVGAIAGGLVWMATPLRIAIQSWPPHQWPSISPDDAANLVVLGLAVYGGLAILLVTAGVLIDLRRVRLRIINLSAPVRTGWLSAFAGTGVADLAERVVALAPVSGPHGTDDLILRGFAHSWLQRFKVVTAAPTGP